MKQVQHRTPSRATAIAHRPRGWGYASGALLLALASFSACHNPKADDASDTRSTLDDEAAPRWQGADGEPIKSSRNPRAARATGRARLVAAHNQTVTPTATLPGFRMLSDGRSRVFLELSGDVPMTESHQPGRLSYRFAGVRVPARVNRLALPTSYFPTPVARVQLNQVGSDAVLVIELKSQVDPSVRVERKGGAMVVSADFPRLADLPPSSAAAPPKGGG